MFAGCSRLDGEYTLHILSTNDVHGAWFDTPYVDGAVRPSLMAVNTYVDSIRKAAGRDNVLLIDAGDCLQGDNATYYYNYVDTVDEQIAIARRKGNIGAKEKVTLWRFEVKRHV